jgi:hypothetical protein
MVHRKKASKLAKFLLLRNSFYFKLGINYFLSNRIFITMDDQFIRVNKYHFSIFMHYRAYHIQFISYEF